jgi:hypothetical protein
MGGRTLGSRAYGVKDEDESCVKIATRTTSILLPPANACRKRRAILTALSLRHREPSLGCEACLSTLFGKVRTATLSTLQTKPERISSPCHF